MSFREDIQMVFAKDPAARSILEVITCDNGLSVISRSLLDPAAEWPWRESSPLSGRYLFFTVTLAYRLLCSEDGVAFRCCVIGIVSYLGECALDASKIFSQLCFKLKMLSIYQRKNGNVLGIHKERGFNGNMVAS